MQQQAEIMMRVTKYLSLLATSFGQTQTRSFYAYAREGLQLFVWSAGVKASCKRPETI